MAGVIGPLIGGYIFSLATRVITDRPANPMRSVGANFYMSAFLAFVGSLAAICAVRHSIDFCRLGGSVVENETEFDQRG